MKKEVYLPDDRETRALLHQVADEQQALRKSFSEIVREALQEHAEKRRAWVQARLTEFPDEFAAKMEGLHAELIYPNSKRYRTWRECLEVEGVLTEEAISYSVKRGWKVEG